MSYMSSLDIDRDDGERLLKAERFILWCKYSRRFRVSRSPSGTGWHVRIYCIKRCEMCRKLFDDPIRYKADKKRPIYGRNILHREKYLLITIGGMHLWAPWPGKEWVSWKEKRKRDRARERRFHRSQRAEKSQVKV